MRRSTLTALRSLATQTVFLRPRFIPVEAIPTPLPEIPKNYFHDLSRDARRMSSEMVRQPAAPLEAEQPKKKYARSASYTKPSASIFSLPPEVKLFNSIYQFAKEQSFRIDFGRVLFVCGQHALETTHSLYQLFIALGAKPERILTIGKPYSNCEAVIDAMEKEGIRVTKNSKQLVLGDFPVTYNADISRMWEEVDKLIDEDKEISCIIVLDDGGHVIENMPAKVKDKKHIFCIEQTSSGKESEAKAVCPSISVADSHAKLQIEPPFVAAKIVKELRKTILKYQDVLADPEQPHIFIGGIGTIGYAVLKSLIETGFKNITIYDLDQQKLQRVTEKLKTRYKQVNLNSASEKNFALAAADIIIGATGKDMLAENLDVFKLIKSPKILVSCSSKDTEFRSLLHHIHKAVKSKPISPLEDIRFKNGYGADLIVVRGGTPINFNNERFSVPSDLISVIRGLIAMAVIQAYKMMKEGQMEVEHYMVAPDLQAKVVNAWLNSGHKIKYTEKQITFFTDPDEIFERSGGAYYEFNQRYTNGAASKL